jgi:hypothetical protein
MERRRQIVKHWKKIAGEPSSTPSSTCSNDSHETIAVSIESKIYDIENNSCFRQHPYSPLHFREVDTTGGDTAAQIASRHALAASTAWDEVIGCEFKIDRIKEAIGSVTLGPTYNPRAEAATVCELQD